MKLHETLDFSPIVREHAQNPRNNGPLSAFNGHARITGPCGDTMEIWLLVRDHKVKKVSFSTDGCEPAIASGSMTTCLAIGKSVTDAAAMGQQDILHALGGLPAEVEHCALLAANTLKAACEEYLHNEHLKSDKASSRAGATCDTCSDSSCSASRRRSDENDEEYRERQKLEQRLCRISHKIVVMSGKGGVGKSTVAVNLAIALARSGKKVGLLDVDIHGPSVPTMLGLEFGSVNGRGEDLLPADLDGLKVLSLGLFLSNQDDAVIWRGPMKTGVIRQFLKDVAWGDLDFLVVDSPPGTGDEPLSVCQLLGRVDGAVIVTTPQKVAAVDVRKSISFCRQMQVPVLGVVENMSGFACPHCGQVTPILRTGGGRRIAEDMKVPFLGSIPIDPKIAESCDDGHAFLSHYADSPTAKIMQEIIQPIKALDGLGGDEMESLNKNEEYLKTKEDISMRIAIPIADGKLSMHFGHCGHFALVDVDPAAKKILKREDIEAPPHQPGLLPPWLGERGATLIIAGGMGQRAQNLFAERGIQVIVGAPAETPERLITDYLAGTLEVGDNVCDH
ncbi:MAG: iron-sulfur cluster carrier protein MrpORP [bacterium]